MLKSKQNWLILIAVSATFICHSGALLSAYGFLDDYVFLENVKSDKNALINLLVSAGRPINAWAYELSFSIAGNVENLVALRFLSVSLLLVFAGLLFAILKDLGLPKKVSLIISVLVGSSTSFSVFASWAQHWTTSLTLVIVAFCAYWLNQNLSKKATRTRPIIVMMLLSAAALIYVPAALVFPIFITLRYVIGRTQLRGFLREMTWASTVILISAFVSLRIGQNIFPSDAERFQLSDDVITKTLWFARFPLFQALTPWVVAPTVGDALLLAGALVVMIFFWKKMPYKGDLKNFLAVTFCALIVSLPNLLTSENWASYRSTVALNTLVIIFGALAIWRIFARNQEGSFRFLKGQIQLIGVPLIISLAIAKGAFTTGLIVQPNTIEYRNLVQVTEFQEADCAVIQISSWTDSKFRPQAYDEFGIYSGSVPIVAKSMAALALDLDLTKVSTTEEYLRSGDSCESKIEIEFRNLMEPR